MSGKNPLSFLRRIERQWAERIKSLRQIRDQIVVAAGKTLQTPFHQVASLIPIPVRTVVDRRQPDRRRSRD